MVNFLDELRWRGMLFDQTEGVATLFDEGAPVTAYVGFDPTATSLHVGNLVPLMGLAHLQRCGHRPVVLVGGATGMVGDPSGKSNERNLLTPEILARNLDGIRAQLAKFLSFEGPQAAIMVDNADWIGPMSFIEFMRDVGKHFSVGTMLNRESVKRRVSGEGISFTEFGYMILQAYDFYHLYKHHGCSLQMGGSDQWGNITAGVDLIRRMGGKGHGIVFPLLTTASGQKFGKTEAGAVWLDPEQTSPYRFYQFWLNSDDENALQYLRVFSTLNQAQIAEFAERQAQAPQVRDVQKRLAEELTRMVHGEEALQKALGASAAMFGGGLTDMDPAEIGEIFDDVPSTEIERERFRDGGFPILNLFTECGLTASNGEARNLLRGGGLNLNNNRITEVGLKVEEGDTIGSRYVVLRKGAKKYHLIKIVN